MITAQEIWDDLCESENGNPHWKQIRFEEIEAIVDRVEEKAALVAAAPKLLDVLKRAVANNSVIEGSSWWGDVYEAIGEAEGGHAN